MAISENLDGNNANFKAWYNEIVIERKIVFTCPYNLIICNHFILGSFPFSNGNDLAQKIVRSLLALRSAIIFDSWFSVNPHLFPG